MMTDIFFYKNNKITKGYDSEPWSVELIQDRVRNYKILFASHPENMSDGSRSP